MQTESKMFIIRRITLVFVTFSAALLPACQPPSPVQVGDSFACGTSGCIGYGKFKTGPVKEVRGDWALVCIPSAQNKCQQIAWANLAVVAKECFQQSSEFIAICPE